MRTSFIHSATAHDASPQECALLDWYRALSHTFHARDTGNDTDDAMSRS